MCCFNEFLYSETSDFDDRVTHLVIYETAYIVRVSYEMVE